MLKKKDVIVLQSDGCSALWNGMKLIANLRNFRWMLMDNFFIVFHLFYQVKLHEYEIIYFFKGKFQFLIEFIVREGDKYNFFYSASENM